VSAVAEAVQIQRSSSRLPQLPWTPLLRYGSLAVMAAALAVGAALGEPQAIVTGSLVLALSTAVVWFAFKGTERRFILTLFLVAFAARIVAAVASHFVLLYMGRDGFALMDDRAYDKLGWTLARVWVGRWPGIRDTDVYLMVNYTYLVAAVYYVLGHSLLAAKMLNVAFGSLLAVVSYATAREIFDQRVARIAAMLTAFFPSLLLWSAINLKDILVVLLTAVAVFGLIRYARRHEWWALALCLAAFLAVENLRMWIFFILAWLLPAAFVFTDRSEQDVRSTRVLVAAVLGLAFAAPIFWFLREGANEYHQFVVLSPLAFAAPSIVLFAGRADRRRKLFFLIPVVLGVMLLSYATNNEKLGTNFLTPKALTNLEWKRWLEENKAESGNGEFDGVKPPVKEIDQITTRTLNALPRGVFFVLFGPTPFQMRSLSSRAVLPEMLAWYVVLAAAVVGLWVSFRSKWRDLVLPMALAGGCVVVLALSEGNTGNIFRHRSQVMPYVFLVSSVGLVWMWGWWRQRRAAPADVVLPSGTEAAKG
jgi:hypothetical protein